MECVYPPVRQNSQLVFLPGRNHVELRRIGWSSCSFQSGRQQVRFITMELYSRIWICQCYQCWIDEALCFHARSLIRREPRKKWEPPTYAVSWAHTRVTGMHEHSSASDMCIVHDDQVERTSPPSWLWHLQPFISSRGTRRCSCIKSPWHHGIGSSWLEASGFNEVRWNPPRSEHFKVLPKLPKMTWFITFADLQHEMMHSKWMQMN